MKVLYEAAERDMQGGLKVLDRYAWTAQVVIAVGGVLEAEEVWSIRVFVTDPETSEEDLVMLILFLICLFCQSGGRTYGIGLSFFPFLWCVEVAFLPHSWWFDTEAILVCI